MTEMEEHVELEIAPVAPDSLASLKSEIIPLIEQALREANNEDLLREGQIQVDIDQTFPVDAAIILGLTFLSQVALETYKAVILPELKRRYAVKQRSRHNKNRKDND